MKAPSPPAIGRRQTGISSVITLLFLTLVVLYVLSQSLSLSGSKSLETQQYFDGVAALALAESGNEVAVAGLTNAINLDDTAFLGSCAGYTSSSATALGRGSFQFVPTSTASSNARCPVRVRGTVGAASRTLESWISFSNVIGIGDYSTSPSLTLTNPYGVPAMAVFNLAWRRHGSTGQSPPGGQSAASSCILPSCGMQWNLESSSGNPSIGSLGTSVGVPALSSTTVTQTLSSIRNYAEVGLILGGSGSLPAIKGSYADSKETANTQNQTVTTGTTTSGEAKGWCTGADTLVFGVSGRGNDDPNAAFNSVVFNSAGNPAQPIAMTWVSHYPNTDGSSPNTFGDVFSEIWYTYNPYVSMSNASSVGTTVTSSPVAGLKTGTILKVYTGTGQFQGNTTVTNVISPTQFTVSKPPSTPLVNATLCGGICALFDNPSSGAARSTTFALTRASSAAQQWAGGFVCFSGVDPNKVRRVSYSSVRQQQWHEVATGE